MPIRVFGDPLLHARAESTLAALGPLARDIHLVCRQQVTLADVREIRDTHVFNGRRVIVLLGTPPKPYASRVLTAVVDGVVLADDMAEALHHAVRAVEADFRVVPRSIVRELRRPTLSAREKQVLAMVVLDMSNGEIAQRLHVSESNVKFHLSSAFAKLGVRSRTAAAALILDPDEGLGTGILRITDGTHL